MPNPSRKVHPGIADPVPGAALHGTAPKLQYADGLWNHGEGFELAPGLPDADTGGWFGHDAGLGLTAADINLNTGGWVLQPYVNPLRLSDGAQAERVSGYLRPAGLPLPTWHPRYGNVGPYVDQGAFEIFRPLGVPYSGQKVLIVIRCFATVQFPKVYDPTALPTKQRSVNWYNTYRGYFSPDGLVRDEFASSVTVTGNPIVDFQQNTDDNKVGRFLPDIIASWYSSQDQWLYYPIEAYPVLTVPGRQTELNEQRYLQMVQAVKLLLMESSPRNPLGDNNALTAQQIEDDVVVVFDGGSNGGTQSSFIALRHPEIVHGIFAQVINPSMQRLFGEQDLGWAVAELSGSKYRGATVDSSDYLNWGQYAWNQGLEIHDLSFLRQFFTGNTYRPACFYVGDEDLTSTGTDWIQVATNNTGYSASGLKSSSSTFGNPAFHTFAWMAAENANHSSGFVEDPYHLGTPPTPHVGEIILDLAKHAVNQRAAQLALSQNPTVPPILPQPRTTAQQLRGLEDPHEWFFGRGLDGPQVPSPNAPLVLDQQFTSNSQPGGAGTWLGNKEAMFIRDERVYVSGADGVVSIFKVDLSDPTGRAPLARIAQSERLGYRGFGLAPLSQGGASWSVIAATRRHLFLLDKDDLTITAASPLLPWEVAEPRGIQVGDVLPGHPGQEIVFRTEHGGLVFCDTNLNLLHEWSEPGIEDFLVQGSAVVIVSNRRTVLAKVQFDMNDNAELLAVSQPLPTSPTDPSSQGVPLDLELMKVNISGMAFPALVSLWKGDEDGTAVRVHDPVMLQRMPVATGTHGMNMQNGTNIVGTGGLDIATCKENIANPIGDHLLLLIADNLRLYDQGMNHVGTVSLRNSAAGFYPFGTQACAIAVGELVPGPASGYQEEVVVATQNGHLVWLHIEDVAAAGTAQVLSADFDAVTTSTSGTATHVQPHTNQALSATWSIAENPNDPGRLQLLDQGGAYWRVDSTGVLELYLKEAAAGETKGWEYVGAVSGVGPGLGAYVQFAPPPPPLLATPGRTFPWCADQSNVVHYEKAQPGKYLEYNWRRGQSAFGTFDEMFPFLQCGDLIQASAGGTEAWYWSQVNGSSQGWGNHLDGLRITGGLIDGLWASTTEPVRTRNSGTEGDLTPYLDLRNVANAVPAMNYQGVRAVEIQSLGPPEIVVVLGCPGGRVRVIRPGAMRTGAAVHTLGSVESTPYDLGFGGGALAVRLDSTPTEQVRIWFGTHYGHVRRPAAYGNSQGTLADSELAVGEVHRLTWTPGNPGSFSQPTSVRFEPSPSNPRGAYGITGLLVTDLLQNQQQYPGDELIVATMSGDLVIMNADTMQEYWRTHVPGAIGFYNSIVVSDLDGDGKNELYVAGSQGLWKFEEV